MSQSFGRILQPGEDLQVGDLYLNLEDSTVKTLPDIFAGEVVTEDYWATFIRPVIPTTIP